MGVMVLDVLIDSHQGDGQRKMFIRSVLKKMKKRKKKKKKES